MKFEISCYDRETAQMLIKKFAEENISTNIISTYGMNPCGSKYLGEIEDEFLVVARYGYEGVEMIASKTFFDVCNKVEMEFNDIFRRILDENREIKLSGVYRASPEIYGVAVVPQ